MNKCENIRQRFSAAATTYSQEAVIQEKVSQQLIKLMEDSGKQPLEILELGCGTGLLTRKLSKLYPKAHITAVDISEKMIMQAQQECASCKRIKWIIADAVEYTCASRFDIIASSSALHWMQPIRKTFSKSFNHLKKNGAVYFGMMTKETLKELHSARKAVIPGKLPKKSLPSARSVIKAIESCGFSKIETMTDTETLLYKDMRSLLNSLHNLGVTGGSISGNGTLLTPLEIKALMQYMDSQYGRYNIPATYEILYLTAIK